MLSYKHSPFDEDLCAAMEIYNQDKPSSEKFTLVDARIASLVHSYTYSDKVFFASNDYLAKKCFTTAATVQKSINRLCLHDILYKKVSCTDGKKQRFLYYNESGAEEFKSINYEL
jgi:hypothetical protein